MTQIATSSLFLLDTAALERKAWTRGVHSTWLRMLRKSLRLFSSRSPATNGLQLRHHSTNSPKNTTWWKCTTQMWSTKTIWHRLTTITVRKRKWTSSRDSWLKRLQMSPCTRELLAVKVSTTTRCQSLIWRKRHFRMQRKFWKNSRLWLLNLTQREQSMLRQTTS